MRYWTDALLPCEQALRHAHNKLQLDSRVEALEGEGRPGEQGTSHAARSCRKQLHQKS